LTKGSRVLYFDNGDQKAYTQEGLKRVTPQHIPKPPQKGTEGLSKLMLNQIIKEDDTDTEVGVQELGTAR
jgi:hypothetical protein